jgi:hypothetical protein
MVSTDTAIKHETHIRTCPDDLRYGNLSLVPTHGGEQMSAKYSDIEIARMIEERKTLPDNYRSRIQLRNKRGHKEGDLDVKSENGTHYRIILNQSDFNTMKFSVILAVHPENSSQMFRLRRYNGKHGEHTNPIEGNKFYDFHIHQATERYQKSGGREDTYAEPTDRYVDLHTALHCMLEDCGFEAPQDAQLRLFGEFNV